MGERIFRPGIRSSDRAAANVRAGGWISQVFYDWLLTAVDDFGRFDARPLILRTQIFPMLLDLVREADVSRCLESCKAAGLIRLYMHDGKPYLEVLNFRQRLRAKTSKWPGPQDNATPLSCERRTMPTDTDTDTDTPQAPKGAVDPPGFIRFWNEYPRCGRKVDRKKCLKKWATDGLEQVSGSVLTGLRKWIKSHDWQKENGQFIPMPITFLNQSRWEAEFTEPPQSPDQGRKIE